MDEQRKDWWCGPATLSYALLQVGIDVDQEKIAKDTGTTKAKGVDPFPLQKVAERYGAETEIMEGETPNGTLAKMDEAVKDGAAVIVDYLVSGDKESGHYIVFLGQSGNSVRIWNPSDGKKDELDKSYFIENWRDRTESGKVFKNWAMVLRA